MKAYVYILASQRNGTLYTGVTTDLGRRLYEHQHGLLDGFSKKYKTKLLVYVEQHESIDVAIKREKAIKKWNRQWKLELIEVSNPDWADISGQYS